MEQKETAAQPPVSQSPDVMGGAFVFTGTRVPVRALADYLTAGHELEEFFADFPTVRREHAFAALALGLEALEREARRRTATH